MPQKHLDQTNHANQKDLQPLSISDKTFLVNITRHDDFKIFKNNLLRLFKHCALNERNIIQLTITILEILEHTNKNIQLYYADNVFYWRCSLTTAILDKMQLFMPYTVLESYGNETWDVVFETALPTGIKVNDSETEILLECLEQNVEYEINIQMKQERLLAQQSKMASIGELMSMIAHQWRQPLTVTSGYLDLLEDTFFETNAHEIHKNNFEEYKQVIKSQITYMTDTINDFKDFFQSGQEKTNFCIVLAIQKSINIASSQLKNQNIRVDLIFNDSINQYTVLGVQNQFQQAMINILINAHDAIENAREKNLLDSHGEGLVTITVQIKNEQLLVNIKDNGGGIKLVNIDKVFEPYFTTKFQSRGTGIGLYMVKSIIEQQLNGAITVSNNDTGAEFSIVLPIT